MKKILLTSIFILSVISVKAQSWDNHYFTNLYAKNVEGNSSEEPNYRISNILTPAGWVLDTKWWGHKLYYPRFSKIKIFMGNIICF